VLAYRSAGAAELIANGSNGRLVAPGDENAFIDAARALVADRRALHLQGGAARLSVLSRGWGKVIASFEQVAEEAIATPR
jgi:glycosyltransferase involved in cell wall biosynthesis